MPLTYWVDADLQIVRSVGTGALTMADIRDYFVATRVDPLVLATMHRLLDLRQVTSLPTSDEIREMATLARGMPPAPEAKMVILADTDLGFGVSMMFKGFVGYGDRLVVLRSEAEAMDWLSGRPPITPRRRQGD